jgi:hypothetical protein
LTTTALAARTALLLPTAARASPRCVLLTRAVPLQQQLTLGSFVLPGPAFLTTTTLLRIAALSRCLPACLNACMRLQVLKRPGRNSLLKRYVQRGLLECVREVFLGMVQFR